MKNNYTFWDFISDIVDVCVNPNDIQTSPHDINFTNHYVKLYDMQDEVPIAKKGTIKKVIQNKKTKELTVQFDKNITGTPNIKEYCEENDIDCKINKKTKNLMEITINKNSKGVAEDRQWKTHL